MPKILTNTNTTHSQELNKMTNHNQRVIDILTTVASGRIDSRYITYNDGKWNIVRTKPISGRYQAIDRYQPYLKLQIEYFVNSVSI